MVGLSSKDAGDIAVGQVADFEREASMLLHAELLI